MDLRKRKARKTGGEGILKTGQDEIGPKTAVKKKKMHKENKPKKNFFSDHFCTNMEDDFLDEVKNHYENEGPPSNVEFDEGYSCSTSFPINGVMDNEISIFNDESFDLHQLEIPRQLLKNKGKTFEKGINRRLFHIMQKYIDVYCVSKEDFTEQICLHILSHSSLTRQLIISNKKKLEMVEGPINDNLIEETRDQGLARPKVLVLLPFRKHAQKLVQALIKTVFGDEKPFVMNSQKFEEEFGDDGNRVNKNRNVSDEYKKLMSGNVDDCFRLGISMAKKCLKLYVPFDDADILVCSPLGLRMIIGGEGDKKREYDFLASIEVLVLDMADIFLMQNWEHVLNIFETVNSTPTKVQTDISRIRNWSTKNQSKFYRQTIVFSRINSIEICALFPHFCANYEGSVYIAENPVPTIDKIEVPVKIELRGFGSKLDSPEEQTNKRMEFFIKKILPETQFGTLVFIPSYFDFVRLRNHLKRENESFVQLHEYAEKGKVAKGRQQFLLGERKLMLMTERFYFFYRYRIKGIKTMVFYQPPVNPGFFHEILNMSNSDGDNTALCTIVYNHIDLLRLQNIFGTSFGETIVDDPKQFIAL